MMSDGTWNSEASMIGKEIGLTRVNVKKMLSEQWIRASEEPTEDSLRPTKFVITSEGELTLLNMNENDYKPQRSYFTHDEIKDILRNWYKADGGWISLTELSIEDRRIDVYVLGIRSIKAYTSIGFEIKVNRSDLTRDLNESEKRAPLLRYCHQFFYVITKGLAKGLEFPPEVGLIEIWKNKSRHILIDAPWNKIGEPYWPLTGNIAARARKEYKKQYDWNKGEWAGEDTK